MFGKKTGLGLLVYLVFPWAGIRNRESFLQKTQRSFENGEKLPSRQIRENSVSLGGKRTQNKGEARRNP